MDKWGYKGIETSLNGLTNWLDDVMGLKGKVNEKYEAYCKLIVKYGKEALGLELRGHLHSKASYVAKKIQKDGFIKFSNWVKDSQTPPSPIQSETEVSEGVTTN